ncbi:MAG TPA: T9SS type A sorting domain-containing protein [Candidatus Marinimicrobia bacterium]|nr:T9SS type A sorting domain-containing protein [Candidatus Neomarinimicrobiota bacterium]
MVGITAVNVNQINQFVIDNGITFPILNDTPSGQGIGTGVIYDQYYIPNQGSPYPRDFIVDQNGTVVYANNEIDTEGMIFVIEDLLEPETNVGHEMIQNEYVISKAYPNPFNNSTTISFSLLTNSKVWIKMYNLQGKLIIEKQLSDLHDGQHEFVWNADENNSSGVYFYQIISERSISTGKVLLIK